MATKTVVSTLPGQPVPVAATPTKTAPAVMPPAPVQGFDPQQFTAQVMNTLTTPMAMPTQASVMGKGPPVMRPIVPPGQAGVMGRRVGQVGDRASRFLQGFRSNFGSKPATFL